jgi:2'-5' RNA ligase
MNEQFSPFELPPDGCTWFLGIFPDSLTAQCITDLGDTLCHKYRMYGWLRPTTHLHVSLCSPNPAIDIDHVCKAVTAVTRPFEICFDRVTTFGGQFESHAIVLADDDHGNNEARRFQASLRAEFSKCAPKARKAPKFSPHVTFLYSRQELVSQPIDPMFWTVKEIILIASEVGATKYYQRGCWQLKG